MPETRTVFALFKAHHFVITHYHSPPATVAAFLLRLKYKSCKTGAAAFEQKIKGQAGVAYNLIAHMQSVDLCFF